jgi:hypothetical protein
MEGVVVLNASTGRLEGWGSLAVGGPMELVIWRSVSSLETAPMWVSPTQHWILLPVTRLAGRIILLEQNIKTRTGPALCLLCALYALHTHKLQVLQKTAAKFSVKSKSYSDLQKSLESNNNRIICEGKQHAVNRKSVFF